MVFLSLEMQAEHGSTVALNGYEKLPLETMKMVFEVEQLMLERWQIINILLSLKLQSQYPTLKQTNKLVKSIMYQVTTSFFQFDYFLHIDFRLLLKRRVTPNQ